MNSLLKRWAGVLAIGMTVVVLVAVLGATAWAQGPKAGPGNGMMGRTGNGSGMGPMMGLMLGLDASNVVTGTTGFSSADMFGMMGNVMQMMQLMNGINVSDTVGADLAMPMMRGWNMGGWNAGGQRTGQRLSSAQIEQRVADYIAGAYKDAGLRVAEVLEFDDNFYVRVHETASGVNAFELLANPYTGNLWPEFGPNMMWNLKYGRADQMPAMRGMAGMMGLDWNNTSLNDAAKTMTVTAEDAISKAQQYLDRQNNGSKAANEAEPFYGYYTIDVLDKDGKLTGMLSVNGYSGQVWYHTWHGKPVTATQS